MSNFYEVARSAEKDNITVLCPYSADRKSLPPMINNPYKTIPLHIGQFLVQIVGSGIEVLNEESLLTN